MKTVDTENTERVGIDFDLSTKCESCKAVFRRHFSAEAATDAITKLLKQAKLDGWVVIKGSKRISRHSYKPFTDFVCPQCTKIMVRSVKRRQQRQAAKETQSDS